MTAKVLLLFSAALVLSCGGGEDVAAVRSNYSVAQTVARGDSRLPDWHNGVDCSAAIEKIRKSVREIAEDAAGAPRR